jgi:N-acetylmuramoyl-L-alanine amidase
MIFLSAGHSAVDPGATAFGRKEADIAVEFRNLVSFYLMRANIPHHLDGGATENLPLAQTVHLIGDNRPALEFHCNAGPPSASGVETLSAPHDMALGRQLCGAIAKVFDIPDRGAKPEDSGQHHRLAFVKAGGIIVELFFITSWRDLGAYDARKWLAARAVAEVLGA